MRSGVIASSLLLTALIFALGILLNYGLDFVRIDSISGVIAQHELDTTAYLVEQEFTDSFGGNRCALMSGRIEQLKEEIQQVGTDLGSYSSFSFFKQKDYDYLKRKYSLLELRFLTLIEQLNKECNHPYIPILFFYQIDDDASERQGFILEDLSKEYTQQVVVLSLDKGYADEPLIQLLVARENITRAPTVIVDHVKMEGLQYTGLLNATIRDRLKRADPFAQAIDFRSVLTAAGRDVPSFAANLSALRAENLSPYARADLLLMLGRITKNDTLICDSQPWYDRAFAETNDTELQALIDETIASVDCGRNKQALFRAAAERWTRVNNTARARMDEGLASGKLTLKFETSTVEPHLAVPANFSRIIIGETGITLHPGDRVLAQADRVKRDWLGLQVNDSLFGSQILTTFSERLWDNASELRAEIGWHEGGRLKELVDDGIVPVVAYGTLAARQQDKWYGTDENGVFSFEIPLDKISYPTTRFLRDDIAVLMDTHGMNMMVEQALRDNVTAVIACCDHPGKIKAAEYLSSKGIAAICFPDKYLYLALGSNTLAVGSPPMTRRNASAIVIGDQPVTVLRNESIVVMNSTDHPYALWYYQTPANFFAALHDEIPQLNVTYVQVNDFNQMDKVIRRANALRAQVIAVRVFNSNDYGAVKGWLLGSPQRRALFFHTTPYPYGYLLTKEFVNQTSFDDPNPRFA